MISSSHCRRMVLVALGLVGACAAPPRRPDVVWPPPPELARIKFVQAFRQTDDLDQSGWARFRRKLFGGSEDPPVVQPMGLAISDSEEHLYIADFSSARVLVADFSKKRVSVFAPDEPMGKPFDVVVDADENVYVSDQAAKGVRVFTREGERKALLAAGQVDRPLGMAIDRKRRMLYVCDGARKDSPNHRVRAFSLDGKHLFDLGPRDAPPAKGAGDGQFHFPTYVAVDKEGQAWVADAMNFRIQVFDPQGKFVRKYGEHGDGPGFFARLKGIAFDGFGNFYVVDGGHSNVQIFNQGFDLLMFFGGYAQKLEYFDIPSAIAIHPKSNRIYVGNQFLSRINVYQLINTKPEDSQAKPPAANQASVAR